MINEVIFNQDDYVYYRYNDNLYAFFCKGGSNVCCGLAVFYFYKPLFYSL